MAEIFIMRNDFDNTLYVDADGMNHLDYSISDDLAFLLDTEYEEDGDCHRDRARIALSHVQ